MATQFDAWLATCFRARKGGDAFEISGARGKVVKFTLRLIGDWTGHAMTAHLKANPDAPAVLAAFTSVSPLVAVEAGVTVTRFRFTMSGALTGALPADTDLDGSTNAALMTFMTPPAGDQDFFAGGLFVLLGV